MTGQQLKNSILQMAVQGKLVPQDPNDEPASVLLGRIRKEKEQLIKDGKIKKEKNPSIIFRGADNLPYEKVGNNEPVCIADEVPFDIPDSWEWVRIKNCCMDIFSGKSPKYEKSETEFHIIGQAANQNAGIDYSQCKYTNIEFWETMDEKYFLKEYDVLLNTLGNGTLGRSGIVTELPYPVLTDGHMFVFRTTSEIMSWYIFLYLQYRKNEIEKSANGSTNQTFLNLSKTIEWLVPLPPIDEQFRIIAKYKTILPIIDKYSKSYESCQKLNSLFPELLKKSVLREAVQGKLVPQDSNDEPASVLLERIRAEKQALVKAGKIKKDKNESVIFRRDNSHYEKRGSEEVCIDDEIPFEIPDTWEWCRIGSLLQVNPRNNLSDDTDAGFVPMVLIKDGFNNEHSFEERKWGKIKSGFTHFANNDVIVAKITPCFQNRKSAVIANLPNGIGAGTTELHVLRDVTSQLCMQYILLLFKTNEFIKNGVKNFSGTAGQQRIGKDFISNYLIPLPPVKEQQRIVNSVLKVFSRVNSLAD